MKKCLRVKSTVYNKTLGKWFIDILVTHEEIFATINVDKEKYLKMKMWQKNEIEMIGNNYL